jgi:cell division transport system ATP-binding protein
MGDHLSEVSVDETAAALIDCSFQYPDGRKVFSEINWHVAQGSFAVLTGQTGSGKTTIIRLLLRLVRPSSGAIHVLGESLAVLPARHRPRLRRRIGVVAQDLSLLNDRTVEQNLALALAVQGTRGKASRRRVGQLLQDGLLMHRRHDFPIQLSGGERQRLAVARAAAGFPQLILADEPTAHLDAENSATIVNWLHRLQTAGSTVIVVTHTPDEFKAVPGVKGYRLDARGIGGLW